MALNLQSEASKPGEMASNFEGQCASDLQSEAING